jgi:adenosine kinase
MSLLGMGNPLLDISAVVPAEMLGKYGVKPDDAVLAEGEQLKVYDDLLENFADSVQYIAGGATQNSIRVAQWMSQKAGTTAYIGCIGADEYGAKLKAAATDAGVNVLYREDAEEGTGKCAVLVTADGERSLITDLKAANNYKIEHFNEEPQQAALAAAEIVYSSGFFLTVCPEAMVQAAKTMNAQAKTYMLNLAAPFLMQVPPFWAAMNDVLPYADIVVGNESEAQTFAEVSEWGEVSMQEIAGKIQALPKEGKARIAIVTQGSGSTIIATEGGIAEYPVIVCESLVDTNGAGDAWVGGFLSGLVAGKDIPECVRAANYSANVVIQRSGCTVPDKPDFE